MLRLTLATVAAFTATAVATSLYSSAVHGDLRPDWVVSIAVAVAFGLTLRALLRRHGKAS